MGRSSAPWYLRRVTADLVMADRLVFLLACASPRESNCVGNQVHRLRGDSSTREWRVPLIRLRGGDSYVPLSSNEATLEAHGEWPAADDPHSMLGVARGASPAEIRQAYRKAALAWHPDKFSTCGAEEAAHAEERFKRIGAAYNLLSDPAQQMRAEAEVWVRARMQRLQKLLQRLDWLAPWLGLPTSIAVAGCTGFLSASFNAGRLNRPRLGMFLLTVPSFSAIGGLILWQPELFLFVALLLPAAWTVLFSATIASKLSLSLTGSVLFAAMYTSGLMQRLLTLLLRDPRRVARTRLLLQALLLILYVWRK
jgi:hypothetical protein